MGLQKVGHNLAVEQWAWRLRPEWKKVRGGDGSRIMTPSCSVCSGDCLGLNPNSSFSTCRLTLKELCYFPKPQLPHLWNGYNSSACFREPLWGLNETTIMQHTFTELLLLLVMRWKVFICEMRMIHWNWVTCALHLLLLLLSHFSNVRLCDPIDGSPPGSDLKERKTKGRKEVKEGSREGGRKLIFKYLDY